MENAAEKEKLFKENSLITSECNTSMSSGARKHTLSSMRSSVSNDCVGCAAMAVKNVNLRSASSTLSKLESPSMEPPSTSEQ